MIPSQPSSKNNFKLIVGGLNKALNPIPVCDEGGVQLHLPFLDEYAVVLLNDTGLLRLDSFSAILEQIKPKWFIDVRIAPRMDFIEATRSLALQNLAVRNVNYVDVLGRVNEISEWLAFFENLLKESPDMHGPYIFLFDNTRIMMEARFGLPSFFHRVDTFEYLNSINELQDDIAL